MFTNCGDSTHAEIIFPKLSCLGLLTLPPLSRTCKGSIQHFSTSLVPGSIPGTTCGSLSPGRSDS